LLEKVGTTRSTLATSLTDLQNSKLIERRVKPTRPIQTEYLLTEKGRTFVRLLLNMKELLHA
jgi:DNA-binding HxlR family transcriptional regulator